jgi:hypothetical protein
MTKSSCSTSWGTCFHQFIFDASNYHQLKDMFMSTENWIVCFSSIECTTTVLSLKEMRAICDCVNDRILSRLGHMQLTTVCSCYGQVVQFS